jgi:hypothetical protein
MPCRIHHTAYVENVKAAVHVGLVDRVGESGVAFLDEVVERQPRP